jgi:hypothetical protein
MTPAFDGIAGRAERRSPKGGAGVCGELLQNSPFLGIWVNKGRMRNRGSPWRREPGIGRTLGRSGPSGPETAALVSPAAVLAADELKERLGLSSLPREEKADYQTVGGMVMDALGRVQAAGDGFEGATPSRLWTCTDGASTRYRRAHTRCPRRRNVVGAVLTASPKSPNLGERSGTRQSVNKGRGRRALGARKPCLITLASRAVRPHVWG